MPDATIEVDIGTLAQFTIQGTSDGITPVAGFLPGDGLSARVYAGRDQPTLFSPTVSWANAGAGAATCLVALTFPSALTVGLEAETYEIEVDVIPQGTTDRVPVWKGFVELTGTPGTGVALRVPYVTSAQLRKYAPADFDKLQRDEDLAGFLQFRVDATDWLDEIILKRYYPWMPWLDMKTAAQSSFYDAVNRGQDPFLRQYLLSGFLIKRASVIECVARKALGEVYARAYTGKKETEGYGAVANYNLGVAEDKARGLTAEVDINGDGIADIIIDCSVVQLTRVR